MTEEASGRGRAFPRETLEFERVAFFSDAIFAIAMTLLVVDLHVPTIINETSSRDLWEALGDMQYEILMFFISFAVLGAFWLHHHRQFGRFRAVDRQASTVNLVYLALIAFLPFPSAVLSRYGDNSVAVSGYACWIAAISIVSALLTEIATRHGLFTRAPTPEAVRWQRILPLLPAAFFLATVPIAIVSPSAALYSWILLYPVSALVQRRMPKHVVEFFDA